MDLFQSAIYHDISDEIIAGSSLKSHAFPLPASNSAAAKQMRVVAGLAACGEALERHLFRDSFLTHDHELDKQLHCLASTDRLHHAYLRAALAKVLPAVSLKLIIRLVGFLVKFQNEIVFPQFTLSSCRH